MREMAHMEFERVHTHTQQMHKNLCTYMHAEWTFTPNNNKTRGFGQENINTFIWSLSSAGTRDGDRVR